MKMIEVEAKIKIDNPEKTREKVRRIAKFKSNEKKIDSYYFLGNLKNYPKKSLRIRKSSAKLDYEINFKQRMSYIKGIHAKNESEFKVSDIENFLKLIEDFGFKKWLIKEKDSETYEINKNFHIEINRVKVLGWFLEIEYLTNKKNIKKARSEIMKVINKLNLDKKDIKREGYTKMLWERRGSHKFKN